jgi:hypothetical protein
MAKRLKKGPEKLACTFFSNNMERTSYHAQIDKKTQKRQQEARGMI